MTKTYFITAPADDRGFVARLRRLDHTARAEVYDVLEPSPIYQMFCCRPSNNCGLATRKAIYKIVTVATRRAIKAMDGVIRLRTTPSYSKTHPGVVCC